MSSDKNALCKAMGTLFLQHRVQCLERDVQKLQRSSGDASSSSSVLDSGAPMGNSAGTGGASPSSWRPFQNKWNAGWPSSSRGDPGTSARSSNPSRGGRSAPSEGKQVAATGSPPCTRTLTPPPPPQVIIVDASVLIYSCRSVHEWRKRGDVRLVIPEEAICTLDVLKKGDEMINMAARKAARYLDEHMRCPSGSSSTLDGGGKGITLPGLYPQLEAERLCAPAAAAVRLSQCSDSADGGSTVDDFELKDAPVNIRQTLLAALWYQQRIAGMSKEDVSLAVAVAYPPPQDAQQELTCSSSPSRTYAQRVDGRRVVPWLQSYGFREQRDEEDKLYSIVIAPTAPSWLQGSGKRDPTAAAAATGNARPSPRRECSISARWEEHKRGCREKRAAAAVQREDVSRKERPSAISSDEDAEEEKEEILVRPRVRA